MDKKIAFIGTGAMGGAILQTACQSINPKQIIITDKMEGKAEALAEQLGCEAVTSNQLAAEAADWILLCVKPQTCAAVLEEIGPILRKSKEAGNPKVLVSILAGITVQTMRALLKSPDYPLIRIMPNTPALVGKGLMLISADETVGEGEKKTLETLIADCGIIRWIDEKIMDQGTAVGGCSPAFVYLFIEALADGGVSIGLTREDATKFAAQAVLGAAAMVLETGRHPMALKDMVTSPGGSTIAGVRALEEEGFRRAVLRAVTASYERNVEMGKIEG